MSFGRRACFASETCHLAGIAVDFDEALPIRPGERVQTIDVLRDERIQLSSLLQCYARVMNRVGTRSLQCRGAGEFLPPILQASCRVAQKLIERNRAHGVPNALRSAEIGYSTRSRNTGAGDHQHRTRIGD